jgi:HSP20 family protein
MSLVKWDPFRDMDDAFGRMLPSMFGRWPRVATDAGGSNNLAWAPTADISETDSEFLIRAELPAVKKEDVKITVEHGVITIQGERKDKQETKDEKFHRVESFQGTFVRSFALPDNLDEQGIRAESRDGVLTVHLPKAKVNKPKAIDVKVT